MKRNTVKGWIHWTTSAVGPFLTESVLMTEDGAEVRVWGRWRKVRNNCVYIGKQWHPVHKEGVA